jgi:hypothetical protein
MVMIQFFCNERAEKSPQLTQEAPPKIDTTLSGNFATAQITLNIETLSDNALANASLDFPAIFNNKGIYKTQKLIVDAGDNGPFSSFKIIDKAAISKNRIIQILMSFELQTKRVTWETAKGAITGANGASDYKESIKSECGSIKGKATLLFDEKSMRLISQSSTFNIEENPDLEKRTSGYEDFNSFANKHLKVRLATKIHWTNADCKNLDCTTGLIWEQK